MNLTLKRVLFAMSLLGSATASSAAETNLVPARLRTEYLSDPLGIDSKAPRLSWLVESKGRGQKQTAYQVLVAGSAEALASGKGDLWDSGKVASDETVGVVYQGRPLASRATCFWKVRVWDKEGVASDWSAPARWSIGLLEPGDWRAQWISFKDQSPLHTSRDTLYLPPARHYRKTFAASKPIRRATVYVSVLGIGELHLNGQRVGDAFFESGWADYTRRAYYTTHDVTAQIRNGNNTLGAIVTDGWYAGYVGYGLLVGYGPNKVGRYFYGKTPAFLAQLEIVYADGSIDVVGTDTTWEVSGDGPIREADLIMGERYEARRERKNWCQPSASAEPRGSSQDWTWEKAIRAEENGSTKARFSDNCGAREVELGFQQPPKLQSYSGPPIRVTEEIRARKMTKPKPGVYIFDLGQNFAGVIRLKVKGPAGTKVQIRYGEMLHADGRLMTENLRRARATDFYELRGDAEGETWSPRFTYHGFQFVELTGLPEEPPLDAVTGLVLHSDTPLASTFACSDEVLTKFWQNGRWTQRANFIEVPTDCPQRDERLGWMGDAQAYVRTATYNADVAAFFTKWLDDVEEAQRSSGAYPDYCPYPMGHGSPGQTFGTAWTDAGIICPWTIWQVYGDTRVISRHWASMTRFMDWRAAHTTPEGLGTSMGNSWGDWLNVGETTPIEFIDTCYHALDCKLMAEMASAIGLEGESQNYRKRFQATRAAFQKAYAADGGALKVDTQTAYVLAIWIGLLPDAQQAQFADRLAAKIAKNQHRMTTGFLGTKPLLPALTASGHHDLAVRLFQSRKFPSWGYEVVNGASSVWERWDSYTKEHGFNGAAGNQNASMNSFSHYSFGAVMEWAFRCLAGIDTDGPGFKRIAIHPRPPRPDSNPDTPPISWVTASYDSVRGRIECRWRVVDSGFQMRVSIPANTTATVVLPTGDAATITEGDKDLAAAGVKVLRQDPGWTCLALESGDYSFSTRRKD